MQIKKPSMFTVLTLAVSATAGGYAWWISNQQAQPLSQKPGKKTSLNPDLSVDTQSGLSNAKAVISTDYGKIACICT